MQHGKDAVDDCISYIIISERSVNQMYKILTPIKIGNTISKNRIAYLGMGKSCLGDPDNSVSERTIAYYSNYAKNGVGWITTGACIVFNDYPSQLANVIGLYDEKFLPGLTKLADSIHQYGAKILVQPWHPGISAYGCDRSLCKGPVDFTVDEIHSMQDRFVQAILLAKRAGMDGVEWHMAHNYLPEQFSVPCFNKRTDEYGADTIENAARFSAEIVQKARKVCGDDFVISLKINAWDMGVEGGMTVERCVELCKILEKAGVDLITVSAGGGETDTTGMSGDGYRAEGWKIDFAGEVKKAVSVPVMASGSIRHVDIMEKAIRDGKCDMIGMGRGLLAEPEFVTKLESGRENELRYCVSCMSCFSPDKPHGQHCSLNPNATREFEEPEIVVDGNNRLVVIAGAGPAGVNAAMILAQRGFKPVIYEKTAYIGGSIRYAATPDGKAKLNWAIDYYQRELTRLGVEVHLNTTLTAEMVKELKPYAVFVATGSNPIRPASIPGITGPNVYLAKDILDCVPSYMDEKVAVIGGGMVGLEVATTFAHKGCEATVIEMQPRLNIMMGGATNILAIMHATKAACTLMYEHKVREIKEDGVVAIDPQGKEVFIPATKVMICMGFTPEASLYDQLVNELPNVYKIGDAEGVDNIAKAARDGYIAAVKL